MRRGTEGRGKRDEEASALTFGNPLEDDIFMLFGVRLADDDQQVAAGEGAGGRRSPLVALGHAVHSRHPTTL